MTSDKTPPQRAADMLDVHLLDIVVHVEALLRGIRRVQGAILTARTGFTMNGPGNRQQAADEAYRRLDRMLHDCETLRVGIQEGLAQATQLQEATRNGDS
jgi:hypothetical protein